jgi:hypothetical protein
MMLERQIEQMVDAVNVVLVLEDARELPNGLGVRGLCLAHPSPPGKGLRA